MEIEQVQKYCREALQLAELEGAHASLSFLIGEKFGLNFRLFRKARRKLQFLYPHDDMSEDHPLSLGGRALKMSYALTVQEHYSVPLEQVKHLESLLANFAKAILSTFSQEDIKTILILRPAWAFALTPKKQRVWKASFQPITCCWRPKNFWLLKISRNCFCRKKAVKNLWNRNRS